MAYPPQPLGSITGTTPTTPNAHAGHHSEQRAAINAIIDVLGARPHGEFATVQDRLASLEARVTALGG